MKSYALVFLGFLVAGCAHADPSATDRVIQFLTRAHTGEQMQADEWLSEGAREAGPFKAFGGLDRLIKQSTARAHRYQGLKSVSILNVKKEGDSYLVRAEVRFIEDHRKTNSPAVAGREDMIWNIRVAKESGHWKLWP